MKIGFYGGSFNPPHYGHLHLAENVLDKKFVDKILFIVAYAPPHKLDKKNIDFKHRFKMTEMLIGNRDNMEISDIENILKLNPSYTFNVIEQLTKHYPNDEFSLIIGEDSLWEFHTWKNAHELLEKYEIIYYPRKNSIKKNIVDNFWSCEELEKLKKNVVVGDFFEISSTNIRELLEKSQKRCNIKISELLPEEIVQYAIENKLY